MLPETLMIVEDEVLTRRFLHSVAEKLGIRVLGTCDSGTALLEMLAKKHPRMILMDINIKGSLDGLQTVRKIYQTRPVPIVFITAYADSETLAEAMSLSPYGFVAKPVTPKQLEIALNLACVRCKETDTPPSQTLSLTGGFFYDRHSATLLQDDQPVKLSKKERLLLEILAKTPGHPVSFSVLEAALWPLAVPGPEALASLIKRFRHKTSKYLIVNLYGDGYALNLS